MQDSIITINNTIEKIGNADLAVVAKNTAETAGYVGVFILWCFGIFFVGCLIRFAFDKIRGKESNW